MLSGSFGTIVPNIGVHILLGIKKVLNLIEADIGRSIGDITSKITGLDLRMTAVEVLDTLRRESREIRSDGGNWLSVRVLPYRTIDNVIDGVVINIIDIREVKSI
ncbi:MAG: PAS domain-containing protein [Syntrophobacteraceae bacterium]